MSELKNILLLFNKNTKQAVKLQIGQERHAYYALHIMYVVKYKKLQHT